MANLTKPQADLLLKSVRSNSMVHVGGQRYRTVSNLKAKGYMYEGESRDAGYSHTRAGLVALADYWMRKDASSGCLAWAMTRKEVEAALAAMPA